MGLLGETLREGPPIGAAEAVIVDGFAFVGQWSILISSIPRLDVKSSWEIVDFNSVRIKNQANWPTSSQFLDFCVLISLDVKSPI